MSSSITNELRHSAELTIPEQYGSNTERTGATGGSTFGRSGGSSDSTASQHWAAATEDTKTPTDTSSHSNLAQHDWSWEASSVRFTTSSSKNKSEHTTSPGKGKSEASAFKHAVAPAPHSVPASTDKGSQTSTRPREISLGKPAKFASYGETVEPTGFIWKVSNVR